MNANEKLNIRIDNEIERLNQLKTLVNSLKEGDTLQIKYWGDWVDATSDISLEFPADYRIKPKPRESRTMSGYYSHGKFVQFYYETDAIVDSDVVKFIEVME